MADGACDPDGPRGGTRRFFCGEGRSSIAEKFSDNGIVWRRGENKRISGWDSVRNLLYGRALSQEWGEDDDGNRILLSEEREPVVLY